MIAGSGLVRTSYPARFNTARSSEPMTGGGSPISATRSALSRATLRFRFHTSINELSENLLRAFTMVSDHAHVALVAEINENTGNRAARLVAEARFVLGADSVSEPCLRESWCSAHDLWVCVAYAATSSRTIRRCGVWRIRLALGYR
jgi:hypothetical protein